MVKWNIKDGGKSYTHNQEFFTFVNLACSVALIFFFEYTQQGFAHSPHIITACTLVFTKSSFILLSAWAAGVICDDRQSLPSGDLPNRSLNWAYLLWFGTGGNGKNKRESKSLADMLTGCCQQWLQDGLVHFLFERDALNRNSVFH